MANTPKRITDLEQEATRVLRKVQGRKASRKGRPLFVEFSGTPKAGKSTIINSLRLFLARNKFKVYVLTERASTCPIRNKKHPFFNLWTACATIIQMLEAGQPDATDDVVIMDRGLFDALVWMEWLQDKGELSKTERDIVDQFLTMKTWLDMIDLVFVMHVDPKKALEREFSGQVTRRTGSIMDETTLAEVNTALRRTVDRNEASFRKVLHVDTTDQEAETPLMKWLR